MGNQLETDLKHKSITVKYTKHVFVI